MVTSQEVVVQGLLEPAALSIEITDSTPVALDWETISGVLKAVATRAVLAGKTVYLYRGGVSVSSVKTGADGKYTFYAQFEEGSYEIFTFYAGEAAYWEAQSSTITVTAWRPTTSLTINAAPISGEPPFTVTISGNITRDDTNAGMPLPVSLYRDNTFIETKFATQSGAYSFTNDITEDGDFRYYTKFEGNAKFQGCDGVILPCPGCRRPVNATGKEEVSCFFCGAVSEVVPIFG